MVLCAPLKSLVDHSILRELYVNCRHGNSVDKIRERLSSLSTEERKEVFIKSLDDRMEPVCPPLVIASRSGHVEIVQMLLDTFMEDLDLEVCGKILLGEAVIEEAPPLWCAASSGHFNIVRMLVAAGADVNGMTKSKSTPLRTASFEGRLEIVEFLIQHGADVNVVNKFNNTSLMISAFKGHRDVVRYLLQHGANPDLKACCGATALHFAAESGNLESVVELVEFGKADIEIVNVNGMTPLLAAAERCQDAVVNFLLTKTDNISKRIDALELIGASIANDKDNYDLGKSYTFLEAAMKLRWENPEKVIAKVGVASSEPIEAYNGHVESQSLDELAAIRAFSDKLHMEGLAIRERILGRANPELPHPIIYRGAVFADHGEFSRCLCLWKHALRLKQETKTGLVKDLLRFAQVFCQMLEVGQVFSFSDVLEIMWAASEEIEMCQDRITNPGPRDDPEDFQDDLESNMATFLYLIVILTKLMAKNAVQNETEVTEVMRCLHHVTTVLRPRTRRGRSLIHMAVDATTPVDEFHTNLIVRFPCSSSTKLLLDAGADATDMDACRNTPLHVIVAYRDAVSDFMTLHSIITHLVEARAHVDVVNMWGQTPMEAAASNITSAILKSQLTISLKCMSAQAVMKHRIPYHKQVPETLEEFIQLHGVQQNRHDSCKVNGFK